jgi:hypothetical protein
MLMLHINRFAYDAERNATVKLHQFIAFPAHLKLRPQWLSEDCPDRRGAAQGYRLVASIIHHGRNSQSERGHGRGRGDALRRGGGRSPRWPGAHSVPARLAGRCADANPRLQEWLRAPRLWRAG